MLENVETLYFIKLIFSYVKEKRKLKMAKYNSNLKNKLDISLLNFKFLSQRYINYESKGKGKEYFGHNDRLIFEGEYIRGEKNGKGKEFYRSGNLEFEGEYINGKRNGKGEEYEGGDSFIIFQGEYLNGERWNGTSYYNYGDDDYYDCEILAY